ncbi:MAG: hypothetical protein ABIR91_01920 [Candidatus Saccharimonadales bacterium]
MSNPMTAVPHERLHIAHALEKLGDRQALILLRRGDLDKLLVRLGILANRSQRNTINPDNDTYVGYQRLIEELVRVVSMRITLEKADG